MMADGADQPDFAPGPGILPASGGTVQPLAVQRLQGAQSLQPGQDLISRQVSLRLTPGLRPHGHKFNKTDMKRFFQGEAAKGRDLAPR